MIGLKIRRVSRPGTAGLHSYAAGSTPAMATLHKIATKSTQGAPTPPKRSRQDPLVARNLRSVAK
jgi:hypothetical protein